MRSIKKEIRIIGFDDGPFIPRSKGKVPVIGVIYRGGNYLDGILKTEVEIDGMDSTKKLINVINSSRHKDQLRVIILDGITVGGFNLIDIKELSEKTNLPVLAINRKKPNLNEFKKALKNFKNYKKRLNILKNTGETKHLKIENNKNLYYQCIGLDKKEIEKIIKLSCVHSLIPEPLRVAHLIASGVVKGESKGSA